MIKGIVNGVEKDIVRIPMKGKNLFDKSTFVFGTDATIVYTPIYVGDGTFTLSTTFPDNETKDVFILSGNVSSGASSATNGVDAHRARSVSSLGGYITIATRYNPVRQNPADYTYMLNAGSQALPYEPYGYQEGWEVRKGDGTLIWGRNDTISVNSGTLPIKGYGVPLKSVEVEGNMTQAASQQYSVTGVDSVTYQSNGSNLAAVEAEGNMTQTGTPDPTTPIWPQETGERTGNLFDFNATDTTNGYVNGAYLLSDGSENADASYRISEYIEIQGDTSYTLVYGTSLNIPSLCFYDESKQFISGQNYGTHRVVTKTSPSNARYMRISYLNTTRADVMLNLGSAALPYEPYGYKLTITNAGNTYNVYLSEPIRKIGNYVDKASSTNVTTRPVAKMILTGQETTWRLTGSGRIAVRIGTIVSIPDNASCICTHFVGTSATSFSDIGDGECSAQLSGSGGYREIGFYSTTYSTLEAFKQFISDQYTAGTPVCVWYVLATPVTEQIQFPTIATAQGSNTLAVTTTLAPSKVSVTATSGPCPQNIIWPQETGGRTANIAFKKLADTNISQTGTIISNPSFDLYVARIEQGSVYSSNSTLFAYYTDEPVLGSIAYDGARHVESFVGVSAPITGYLCVRVDKDRKCMINSGSTAIPYEPYGFKLTITNAGQTTPIYLGQTQTVRRVRKLVLTGEESISVPSNDVYRFQVSGYMRRLGEIIGISTHYTVVACKDSIVQWTTNDELTFLVSSSGNNYMYIRDTAYNSSSTAFREFLAAQYSAGTPVTVWYILAEPTTGIVNEPIRKIGTYADTLTVTDQDVTITPAVGNDTITVDTTLAPSKLSLTGHIKALPSA